jgi:hypothetical protein
MAWHAAVSLESAELALGSQYPGHAPAQPHVAVTPWTYSRRHTPRDAECRFNRVGRRQAPAQRSEHPQFDHRQRLLQLLTQARRRIQIDRLQPCRVTSPRFQPLSEHVCLIDRSHSPRLCSLSFNRHIGVLMTQAFCAERRTPDWQCPRPFVLVRLLWQRLVPPCPGFRLGVPGQIDLGAHLVTHRSVDLGWHCSRDQNGR